MGGRLRTVAVASVAALSLTVAACGSDDDTNAGNKPAASEQVGTDTGASTLRAGLTGLLSDHVYLAGIAISTGVGSGLDSGRFKAAAGTLDKNSVALSRAIGGVYGDPAGKQFLELWRAHIGFFVDYTKAKATGDKQGAAAAKRKLDGYRQDFGAFISSANPNLPKAAVASELKPHVKTVFAVIDAVVAKSPSVYDKLAEAASHMPHTAGVLAGGIAKQFPEKFSGSTEDGAAELRSGLTALLTDHVYLAGIAIDTGVEAGLDSRAFKASAGTLDGNSKALSKAIGGVYGRAAGKQFLALWRAHIGMFVDYTKAKATGDDAGAKKALADLDGYRSDFGAFISSANPNLPKQAVAEELRPHVETVAGAIRAVVAKSPKTFERLAEAASHMPHTANVLAGGIVKQHPDKFAAAEAEGTPATTASSASEPEAGSVDIKTFMFDPDPVRVGAGTEVSWTNEDDILHTVTAGGREKPTGTFDEKLNLKDKFSYKFEKAGRYRYVCTIHMGMDGTVIVS